MALAATTLSCGDVPLTAPAGSTVSLIANPPFVVANGGVSVVTAIVIEPAGDLRPRRDGGLLLHRPRARSRPRGRPGTGWPGSTSWPDSRSGTANISAISGGAASGGDGGSGERNRERVGDGRHRQRPPGAGPGHRQPPGHAEQQRRPSCSANVFDENGNPVSSVPVIFTISGGTAQTPAGVGEYLDSGGSQLFTDTNGQVFDTLRSRRPLSDAEPRDGHRDRSQRDHGIGHRGRQLRMARRRDSPPPDRPRPSRPGPARARAEIALLASGTTLKLDGHRLEDGLVVLELRGGGEIGLPPSAVRGFVPDEVVEEVAEEGENRLERATCGPWRWRPRAGTASTPSWSWRWSGSSPPSGPRPSRPRGPRA